MRSDAYPTSPPYLVAPSLGIETVYQDLALVNELSEYRNKFLKRELLLKPLPSLNSRLMREQARQHLEQMRVNVPSVATDVASLSGGQRQPLPRLSTPMPGFSCWRSL